MPAILALTIPQIEEGGHLLVNKGLTEQHEKDHVWMPQTQKRYPFVRNGPLRWEQHILMKPPIMMNVQTVLSMTFLSFLGGAGLATIVFSPSLPSPGAKPSSNLTASLPGLEGVSDSLGPEGVKS
jgi:hypothetical protein